MNCSDWNAAHPVGTKVVLTLGNGKRHVTRTTSAAEHIGSHDFIRVAHIAVGLVLLGWIRPFHRAAVTPPSTLGHSTHPVSRVVSPSHPGVASCPCRVQTAEITHTGLKMSDNAAHSSLLTWSPLSVLDWQLHTPGNTPLWGSTGR